MSNIVGQFLPVKDVDGGLTASNRNYLHTLCVNSATIKHFISPCSLCVVHLEFQSCTVLDAVFCLRDEITAVVSSSTVEFVSHLLKSCRLLPNLLLQILTEQEDENLNEQAEEACGAFCVLSLGPESRCDL